MQTNESLVRGSVSAGFRIQLRVLHALLMREVITRFGRQNLGVLWLIVEPMIFTLGVASIWTGMGMNHGSAIPIVAFAVTGYSSVLMWRNSASRSTHAIWENMGLLFHRRVQVIDVLLTRTLLEIGGATGSFIILSCFFISLDMMPAPVDLLEVIEGWVLLAWFGACLAILVGAGSALSEVVERIWHPASYLLFPLSGAAFMVDWMPKSLQKFVLLLPMIHGTEMLREGWFGNVVRTHYSVLYVVSSCLALSLAGLYVQRLAGRRIEH